MPALYRMTGKPLPTSHSIFVAQVFEPLMPQLASLDLRAPADARPAWAREVAEGVTATYLELTAATLEKVAREENARSRHIAVKRPAAAADVGGGASDSDKIRAQLCLDVAAYGAQLAALGVSAESIGAFEQLRQAVRPDAGLMRAEGLTADAPATVAPVGGTAEAAAPGAAAEAASSLPGSAAAPAPAAPVAAGEAPPTPATPAL